MNDYDRLEKLLTDFGVGIVTSNYKAPSVDNKPCYNYTIECPDGGAKVFGYDGFFTVFIFDHNRKFISVGSFE